MKTGVHRVIVEGPFTHYSILTLDGGVNTNSCQGCPSIDEERCGPTSNRSTYSCKEYRTNDYLTPIGDLKRLPQCKLDGFKVLEGEFTAKQEEHCFTLAEKDLLRQILFKEIKRLSKGCTQYIEKLEALDEKIRKQIYEEKGEEK